MHMKRRSLADMKEKEKNLDNFGVNKEIEEVAGNLRRIRRNRRRSMRIKTWIMELQAEK
jgi:hypothetical protein